MRNMRIGSRLFTGFFILLILMIASSGAALYELHTFTTQTGQFMKRSVIGEIHAREWLKNAELAGAYVDAAFYAYAEDAYQHNMQQVIPYRNKVNQEVEALQKMELNSREKELMASAIKEREAFYAAVNEASKLKASGVKHDALVSFMEKNVLPHRDTQLSFMQQFQEYEQKNREKSAEDLAKAHEKANQIKMIVIGAVIAAVFIGVLIAIRLTRGIVGPLNHAVTVAQKIASGDLTSRIEVTSRDETGQLMQAMRDMNEGLRQATTQVRMSAESIAAASSQIASGTMDLSARTEEQASSLEETASSMEELTSTVRQNGDNARQATQLAAQTRDVVIRGGEASQQVDETMNEIDASARKIVDIITVIDGIAFQTNILALNAAVEAARAGEQGRGFAVVATEVRSLAQRSATAAREIKALIDDSVEKVNSGSALVKASTTTMHEIVDSIRRVDDIMSEISSATQEQVSGIEQVNEVVTQLDTVGQQNAALVEEATAAAESLQDQVKVLMKFVAHFRLDEGSAGTTTNMSISAKSAPAPAKAPPAKLAMASKPTAPKPATPKQLTAPAKSDDEWDEF